MNDPQPESQTYLSTCPACEGVIDVSTLEPYSKVICPHCGQAVRVRRKFDHFSISRQLGEGGMSRVFDAEDSTLERHVALKILNRHYSKDSVRMANFEREARLTAAVTHPNVVRLYSVGRDQGNFYIAMELVAGGSLESRIQEKGRLTEKQALHVGRTVAEGLRAAYREGLIHRDVKPANILFTENEVPKIVDFGLAIFHERDKDESGEIWATPFYVAPEKVREDREDFRSDMFSLGATLYHALVGKPPHKADTNSLHELKVIKSRPVRLQDSGLRFSARTVELINRMLALRPEDRFSSYDDLVEAFRDAESLLGYNIVGRRSRRRKLAYAAIAGSVLTLLLFLLFRPSGQTDAQSVHVTDGVNARDLAKRGNILSAGTETVSDVYKRARNTLVEGRFAEARKLFDDLIQWDKTKQPTLNLARFNAALCAIVSGDKSDAEAYFRAIKRDADEGRDIAGLELKDFFSILGGRMAEDLGLSVERKEASYDAASEQVLGYLVHGLSQWHFGKPRLAAEWLDTFYQCQPGKGLDWITSYKKIVEPYLADIALIKALPLEDTAQFATLDEARASIEVLKTTLASLKTDGSLRQQLNRRLRAANEDINRLKRVAEEAERERLSQMRQRELSQLDEINETLPGLVRGYDFSNGVDLLEGMRFETPEVQNAVADRLYLWSKAREFMTTLMADIQARGHTGAFNRRSGLPFQGRLTRLDYDNATFTLERGQFVLPTATLAPETLVAIAQAVNATISDSTDYYRRQELIVIFAKMNGLEQIASVVASQLAEESRTFRLRWARVAQSGL